MISHGHNKYDILNNYSREELAVFYEKCKMEEYAQEALMIESVMAGIGGAFSGKNNKIQKVITELRNPPALSGSNKKK